VRRFLVLRRGPARQERHRESGAVLSADGAHVGQGLVYLDNIQVGTHTWTSASDNGNGQTITQDPTGEDFVSALLGEPLSVAFPR
jgi:hypothetical protein